MSGASSAGATLPAAISGPAAWAAFSYVFSCDAWSLRFPPDGSDELDVCYDEEFKGVLNGAASTSYKEQARGIVAMRLLEVVSSIAPFIVQRHRKLGDARALDRLRSYVKSRVRGDIAARYDVERWRQDIQGAVRELLGSAPNIERYTGLDQAVDRVTLSRAIKYVFQRCDLQVQQVNGIATASGNYKLERIRNATESDDRTLAWKLVVRFIDATLRNTSSDWVSGRSVSALVGPLHSRIQEVADADGAWGLIHATLNDARTELNLEEPTGLDERTAELLAEQGARLMPPLGLDATEAF